MLSVAGVVCMAVLTVAAPQAPQQVTNPPIPIVRSDSQLNNDGSYSYAYETANQIQAQEQGYLKNAGTDAEAIDVQGSYSYTDNDGNQISVQYTAGENGFQPQGAHLPVAPPIPPEIQEALARNAAEEANLSPAELDAINSGRYLGN